MKTKGIVLIVCFTLVMRGVATAPNILKYHKNEQKREPGQEPRIKCSACRMVAHTKCIPTNNEFPCKPSFKDGSIHQYGEIHKIYHHWVDHGTGEGNCAWCNKPISSNSSKKLVATTCAWCKSTYHMESCFNWKRVGEKCFLGEHQTIIMKPSWITKHQSGFASSTDLTPKHNASPILTPLLVFINPKSGKKQAKLFQEFQWLLNPRQVFDLSQKDGPRMGLELFQNVPNLRILVCGGDGTAGWILSVLDKMDFVSKPIVGVLPLGTDNNLAQNLGWDASSVDEPISTFLKDIAKATIVNGCPG